MPHQSFSAIVLSERDRGSVSDRPLAVAVVIPCYRVRRHVLQVLQRIPSLVAMVFCVDDCCPDGSGEFIRSECTDPRVRVITHTENQGVGGAMITGYLAALEHGADVVVKIDGDGQMDPMLIDRFLTPIRDGIADYAKGNRFYRIEGLAKMPPLRLVANAALSFMSKVSTGYWGIFDPTNGYTAIHATALRQLPLDKLSRRFFFESDMLFRLGTIRAVVCDVPMDAVYESEVSNLSPIRVFAPLLKGHTSNLIKRFFYTYLLRDFSVASVLILFGVPLALFGVAFGAYHWSISLRDQTAATPGTVMVATLPIVLGFQSVLAALSYDISNTPVIPLQRFLRTNDVERTPSAPAQPGA